MCGADVKAPMSEDEPFYPQSKAVSQLWIESLVGKDFLVLLPLTVLTPGFLQGAPF